MKFDKWSTLLEMYKAACQECRDSKEIIYDKIADIASNRSNESLDLEDIKRSEMALKYRIAVEEEITEFLQHECKSYNN